MQCHRTIYCYRLPNTIIVIHTSYVDWSFCIVGGAAHGSIFMVRDYDATQNYNNLFRSCNSSQRRNYFSLKLGLYFLRMSCLHFIHNDTMQALGRPQDMFSDKQFHYNQFCPMDSRVTYSCTWNNISNALATASYIFWWRSCFRFKSCVSSNEFRNS
jgi:photosystem I P700 chlorophyll a apoprotein A1